MICEALRFLSPLPPAVALPGTRIHIMHAKFHTFNVARVRRADVMMDVHVYMYLALCDMHHLLASGPPSNDEHPHSPTNDPSRRTAPL